MIALCGTAVFGSSLAHLDATPALFGDAYQVIIYGTPGTQNTSSPEADQHQVIQPLERHKGIDRITVATGTPISIDGVSVQAAAYSAVTRRAPPGCGQWSAPCPPRRDRVGVVQHAPHRHSYRRRRSGAVRVAHRHARTLPFRVVGTAALPTGVGDGELGLGTGAVLTLGGYEHAVCPHGTAKEKCVGSILGNSAVLASATHGGSGHAAIDRVVSADQNYSSTRITPTTLVNFGEAVDFPLILGAVLAIFGAATLSPTCSS